jgi:hypothetical protein
MIGFIITALLLSFLAPNEEQDDAPRRVPYLKGIV